MDSRNPYTRNVRSTDVIKALLNTTLPGAIAIVVIIPFQGVDMALAQGAIIFLASFAIQLVYLKFFAPEPTTNYYRRAPMPSPNGRLPQPNYAVRPTQSAVAQPHYPNKLQNPPRTQLPGQQIGGAAIGQPVSQLPAGSTTATANMLVYLVSRYPHWTENRMRTGYCPLDPRTGQTREDMSYDRLPNGATFVPRQM